MTDNKRPREFWINKFGQVYQHPAQTDEPLSHVIEYSAYQALALRLKAVEEENEILKSGKHTGWVCSKCGSEELYTLQTCQKIDQLKAEVERLNQALRERLDEINPTGAGTSVSFFYCAAQAYKIELTREKEITSMMREEIGELVKDKPQVFRSQGAPGPFSSVEKKTSRLVEDLEKKYSTDLWTPWLWFNNGWRALQDEIEVILDREAKMRKGEG